MITAHRARLASGAVTPGVARNLLGQVGLETLIPLLRSSNDEFEKWSKNFLITERQTAVLTRLNAAWQDLRTSIVSVKTQFSATFAPALATLAKGFAWLAEKIAIAVRWLQDGGPIATALRWGILGTRRGPGDPRRRLDCDRRRRGPGGRGDRILELVASPVIPIIAAISAIILVAAASIAALILLVDDMWHAFTGGKSVLADLGDKIFGPFFQWLFDKWDLVIAKGKAAIAFLKNPVLGRPRQQRDRPVDRRLLELKRPQREQRQDRRQRRAGSTRDRAGGMVDTPLPDRGRVLSSAGPELLSDGHNEHHSLRFAVDLRRPQDALESRSTSDRPAEQSAAGHRRFPLRHSRR